MFSDASRDGIEARLLKRINEHPQGVDGYLDDLVQQYDQLLADQLSHALTAKAPTGESIDSGDPLIDMTMPVIGKVARTFESSATQATMLQAAIHHRLAQLGVETATVPPVDPWSADGASFSLLPAPDGVGFVLSSRYEARAGQPVTYKFAAPDAGFVRAK